MIKKFLFKRHTVMTKESKQKGLTLAETLMVIAVGAVAIVSGTLLFMDALSSQKLNKATTDLATISSQMGSAFQSSPTFGATGTNLVTFAIDSQNVPPDMIVGTTIRHAWGGNVDLISRSDKLEIIFQNMTKEDCINLISRTGTNTQGGGIEQIRIGGGAPTDLPISPVAAQAACSDGIDIGWLYAK